MEVNVVKTISNKTRKRSLFAVATTAVCAFLGGVFFASPLANVFAPKAETFESVNYDFSDSSVASKFKVTYGSSTPTVSDGKLNLKQWGRTYFNHSFNTLDKDVYVGFDFYAPSTTHFRMSLATDLKHNAEGSTSWVGDTGDAVCFKMCSEGIQVYKEAMRDKDWIGTHGTKYFGALHRMEMLISNGYVKFYIDGTQKALGNGKSIPIPYNTITTTTTDENGEEVTTTEYSYDTYLFFETSGTGVYIDNLIIDDNFNALYDIEESEKSFIGYDSLKLSEGNDVSAAVGWNTPLTTLNATTQFTRSSYYSVGYNWTGGEYYSFKVNNATDSYAGFSVDVANGLNTGNYGLWYTTAEGMPYYLEAEDGSMSVGEFKESNYKDTSNSRNYPEGVAIIPKGFNGRVYIPLTSFEILDWSATKEEVTTHTDDANVLNLARIGWSDIYYVPENTAATGSITISGEALYGKNIVRDKGVTTDPVAKTVKAIGDIGAVTEASEKQIAFARELYNALDETSKASVTNYAVLDAAETTFAVLKSSAAVIGTDGKDFTGTDGVTFTETFASAPATVSAWIRVDRNIGDNVNVGTVIGTAERIGSTIYDRTATFSFEITTNGQPKFEWRAARTDKVVFIAENVDVRTGSWLYVAFTRDAVNGVLTCYVNGVAVASLTTDPDNVKDFTMIKPAIVGSDYTNDGILARGFTPDFNGSIADVRVYDSALTAAEVAEDMTGKRADGLLGGIDFASGEAEYYYNYAGEDGADAYGWLEVENSYFEAKDGEYTFAVIPDTQMLFSRAPNDSNGNSIYSDEYDVTQNAMYKNIAWLVENKELLNLQYVMHVGDLTDCLNYASYATKGMYETKYGFASLKALTDANIPWALARGNHDGGYEAAKLAIWDEYWSQSKAYEKMMTANEDTNAPAKYCTAEVASGVSGTYSYYETFTVGEVDYIVVVLDLEASDTVLTWANEVLTYYNDRKAIVLTHAYLNGTGTSLLTSLMGGSTYHNNGQAIWDEFISQHANVVMAISGHSSGPDIGRKLMTGVNGNKVWNFMIDLSSYEFAGYEQPALMSLLKFSADGKTVTFNLYSSNKSAVFRNFNTFTVTLGEVEETVEEETDTVWNPSATDTRQIVLLPNIQPYSTMSGNDLVTTTDETGDSASLQFAAASGMQFRSGWQAYALSIDITENGIFKFTADAGISSVWTLRIAMLQTSAKDGLTRIIPLTDPDDTDTLTFTNGIYGGTTTDTEEYSVSFAALLPNGVTVEAGDKLTLVFAGTNSDWVYGCYNGAVYDTDGALVKDYTLGIKKGTTNSTATKGLFAAGYNGKLADGTDSTVKNYNGFTVGWLHLTGSFANFFTQYTNTVTVKDESGNVMFTAISSSIGTNIGVQNKLPTLKRTGYKFLGYNIGGTLYAGDTYSVSGTTSTSGTTQSVTAVFEELPTGIFDTDGRLVLDYGKEGFNGALPALTRTGRIFLGYEIGGKLYPAGTSYNSETDGVATAVFANFSTLNGASMRTTSPAGLRFQTYLDLSAYELITASGSVSFGTLIAPEAYITTADGSLDYSALTVDCGWNILNVESTVQHQTAYDMFFNAALVNIRTYNYAAEFVARGYMTVTYADGTTAFFYAGVTDNGRSVESVAEKAYNDVKLVKTDEYKYELSDGTYSYYDDTVRGVLSGFIGE